MKLGAGTHGCTVGQNIQEYRLKYWATRSSVYSFARITRSLAPHYSLCSHALLRSLIRSLAHFAPSLAHFAPSLADFAPSLAHFALSLAHFAPSLARGTMCFFSILDHSGLIKCKSWPSRESEATNMGEVPLESK